MHGENTVKARNLWAEEEDRILRREVGKQGTTTSTAKLGKPRDWRAVAEKLPGRSNKDCRKRWIKLDSKINKGPWSPEENKRLHEAVAKYSTVWTEVAQVVGTRQPDQCAKRWQHFLDPGLNRSEWTPEEDNILIAEVEKRGRNWKQIVDQVLHRRSANDAKNRFTILQRMRQTSTTSNPASTSPSQRRPAIISRAMTATSTDSLSPSPQPEIDTFPRFYDMTPESMSGADPASSHLQQRGGGDAHMAPIPAIAHSELGNDDLHLGNMFFQTPNGKEPSNISSSPSYLDASASGSTPEILVADMDIEPPGSLESWVDYMMMGGTGLLPGTDCSTPALCEDEGDTKTRSEHEGCENMQLDAPLAVTSTPATSTATNTHNTNPLTRTNSTNTAIDPRLPPVNNTLQPQASLGWNWDPFPDMDMIPPNPDRDRDRDQEQRDRVRAEALKSRTMILQQMQPEQISRVMDFLLSWNTPIDVKIVNPE
ncbi:Homeodomain-like protein [Aspergillus heterothallicus]